MLIWVMVFLVIAMVAGILHFDKVIDASVYIAKALFFLFIVLLVIRFVLGIGEITLIEL